MKFKYRVYKKLGNPQAGYDEMPLLQVQLAFGRKRINLDCLVDSGAGESLFSTDIADVLEIDLSNAPIQTYEGIGGKNIQGRKKNIRLHINGFSDSEWIKIPAGFIDYDEMPLIGQRGFFDSYEVIFRRFKRKFEINKRRPRRRSRN